MQILQLTWSRMSSYGGIQSCVRALERAFVELGHSVHSYGLPWNDPVYTGPPDGSPCLPSGGFAAALDSLIDRHRIGGILTHNLLGAYARGIPESVARCARAHHLSHVMVVHDVRPLDPYQERTGYLERVRSEILPGAHVTVDSDFARRAFSAVYAEPDEIVPPGIDFEKFAPDGLPDPRTVAFPGRITRYKGAWLAIEILGALAREAGPLHILLSARERHCTGESAEYFSEIQERAARYPQLSLGFLPAAGAVQQMYRRSAVTLALSEYEGFGMVPMESLACQCPVVAQPVGGMAWLKGVPGAWCVEKPEHAYDALRHVLTEWKAWRSEAARGRVILRRTYDIHTIASRFLSMLECRPAGSVSVAVAR